MEVCEDAITRILPRVEATNIKGSNWLGLIFFMVPCIQALRVQGKVGAKKAWEIFSAHVAEPFSLDEKQKSQPKSYVRSLSVLLKCLCGIGGDAEEDIEWMLDGSGDKIAAGDDYYLTCVLSVSFFSILSEVCLLLAKQLDNGEKKRALVAEGLRYSSLAVPKMKDIDGKVTNGIVFEAHAPVQAELVHLSKKVEYRSSELNTEESFASSDDEQLPV